MSSRPASPASPSGETGATRQKAPNPLKDHLEHCVAIFSAITKLMRKFYNVPSGGVLTVEIQGFQYHLTKRDLHSACSQFKTQLMQSVKIARLSRKTGRTSDPRSFSATFTPQYLGTALQAFFTSERADFGFVDPQNQASGRLLNSLPTLRESKFALSATLVQLFHIYVNAHDLADPEDGTFIRSDDHMDWAFSKHNIDFYGSGAEKVPLGVAESQGINVANVWEYLKSRPVKSKSKEPIPFSKDRFSRFMAQAIIASCEFNSANITRFRLEEAPGDAGQNFKNIRKNLDGVRQGDPAYSQLAQGLLQDYQTVQACAQAWREWKKPFEQAKAQKKREEAKMQRMYEQQQQLQAVQQQMAFQQQFVQ